MNVNSTPKTIVQTTMDLVREVDRKQPTDRIPMHNSLIVDEHDAERLIARVKSFPLASKAQTTQPAATQMAIMSTLFSQVRNHAIALTVGANALLESFASQIGSLSSLADIKALFEKKLFVSDAKTSLGMVDVLETTGGEMIAGMGTMPTEQIIRSNGLAFQTSSNSANVGSHGGPGAVFSYSHKFLLLDAAGLAHLVRPENFSVVKGQRLAQLQEVFANVPHPADPNALKWGQHPRINLENGDEAVAFLGALYTQQKDGTIGKYDLTGRVDGLDQ